AAAAAYRVLRQVQKLSSAPRARCVQAGRMRWKAWQCALAMPGSVSPRTYSERSPEATSTGASACQLPFTHRFSKVNRLIQRPRKRGDAAGVLYRQKATTEIR